MTTQESTIEPELAEDEPSGTPVEPKEAGFSLRSLVFRGATWTFVGFGLIYGLKFFSILILAKYLTPQAYGVAGLVWLYLNALVMFSDLGIGPNVVRSDRGNDPAFLDTAWTLQAGRGFGMWAISLLLGWPMAWFYGLPELAPLIAVASLSVFFLGLSSTALYTCARRLAVWRLVLLDLAYQLLTLGITFMMAQWHPTAWALVAGSVIGGFIRMVLTHLVLGGHRHAFRWEPEAVAEIFTFGRWVLLSSLVTFLAAQSDRMVLGKLIDIKEFGLYSLALTVALAPRELFERLSNQLALPVLVRIIREPNGVARATRVRVAMMAFSALICATLIAVARPGIALVLDDRYQGVSTYLVVLTFGSWLMTVSSTYGALLIGAEHPQPHRYITLGVTLRTLIFFAFLWPAYHFFGAIGVAALASLSELGVHAGSMIGVRKMGFPSLRVDIWMHLVFVTLAAALGLLCHTVTEATGSGWAGVTAVGIACGTLGLAGALVLRRSRPVLAPA